MNKLRTVSNLLTVFNIEKRMERMMKIEVNQEHALRYAGKLLLRKEIDLKEPLFQTYLNINQFSKLAAIKKKGLIHQCQRCGNQNSIYFGEIPCSSCKKTHRYCRKCIEMGRVLACEPLYYWTGEEPQWDQHESPCTWKGTLTSAQERAANAMKEALINQEKEFLIWAVCGAGKTEMLFPGITWALEMGKRICIATPRADVVRELFPRLQRAFSSVTIEALYGGSPSKEGRSQLIIATTHQLLRYKDAFDLLIIDELDAFPFHADPSLPYAARRAKKRIATTIYLTATPRRKEQQRILLKKLPHVYVPIRFHGHKLPVPQMKMCFSLKKNLRVYQLPSTFIHWLNKREQPTRQVLIFVPTISLAEKLEAAIFSISKEAGIVSSEREVTFVHAEDKGREEKVKLFRDKKIKVMITTTILERGVTFPSVDVAILDAGHDVFDEAALVQIAGRAGRSPDDPNGEVIFFHDGKTEAMVQAIRSIQAMNKRGGL